MSKKSNDFYFDNFIECTEMSLQAAKMLKEILSDYSITTIKERMEKFHVIEHNADVKKHEMMSALVKAFITPIERDDIMELSQTIDNVTDSIEDIIIHIYISGIPKIRKDSLEFADLLIQCCEAMNRIMIEFKNFKKSKLLSDMVIEINHLEEDGDMMFMSVMKNLHSSSKDVIEIIAWREIYTYFEKVCDACEDVADIVESIAIGNI